MNFSSVVRAALTVLHVPIYWISRLVPKRDDLWIFGSWFGMRYADNSRFFYEYVRASCAIVTPIWFSRNKRVRERIRLTGGKAASPYSIRGYWLSARAGLGLVSNSNSDLNRFIPPAACFNFWHGFPLKRIRKLNRHERDHSVLGRLLLPVAPYLHWRMDAGIASLSDEHAGIMARAFGVPSTRVRTDGYPRNDILVRRCSQSREDGVLRNAVYMPTFRDNDPFSAVRFLMSSDIFAIDRRLDEMGVRLHIHLHPTERLDLPDGLKMIRSVNDNVNDLHELLAGYDILITDYSSIYIDYLLTLRPIIFFPYDFADYLRRDRELIFDYKTVTPGPHCTDWEEVLDAIQLFTGDPSRYLHPRTELRSRWHKCIDDQASRRTLDFLLRQIFGIAETWCCSAPEPLRDSEY